jgi:enoyl-CoA hydratase/carnithine racemase
MEQADPRKQHQGGIEAMPNKETFVEGLVLERDGPLVTVTIDRPDDANRLSPEVLHRLGALADRLREDQHAQVVVITGGGTEVFSLGILNPVIRAKFSKEQIVALVRSANRVFDAIELLPQIVIAAVNGKTLAGAVELALACDLRYCASHATLAMPEATWGGFPGGGAPVRLPLMVGRARALELMCTGREIDAEQMLRYGLVQDVFPRERFQDAVAALARKIGESGPLATRGAKRIAAARQEAGFRPARELSDALRSALEWSEDVDEGIAAHREQRKPKFLGR